MIVEDNADFRNEFANMLSSTPDLYLAGTASTLAEGLALLEGQMAAVLS